MNLITSISAVGLIALTAIPAAAQQPVRLLNAPCTADTNAPVTESKTGRTFLLDYPCDLKAGEAVTFILNLHGGGSSGTWQRRYFPAFDYKDRYRLVVASPYSPTRSWSEKDDAYLQNIVTSIVESAGCWKRPRVLAGRPFAGWCDVSPNRLHGLFQEPCRRVSEPVGRTRGWRTRTRARCRTAGSSERSSGGRRRRSASAPATVAETDLRLLAHLRNRRTRDRLVADDLHLGAEVRVRRPLASGRRRRYAAWLRPRRRASESGHETVGPDTATWDCGSRSCFRTARVAGWSPTSGASTKVTPKASNRA